MEMRNSDLARTKMLNSFLEPMILKLLREQPLHGYGIIQTIRKQHKVYFGPSTVYPALSLMVKKGLVIWKWEVGERPQKVYTLTAQGERTLLEECVEIRTLSEPFVQMVVH
jgi:DNA-binding PadR family transcriptional regulator